jgi:hypothetical protein
VTCAIRSAHGASADLEHWTLLASKKDRSFVRVTPAGKGEHTVVFTAPDRAEALTSRLPPEQRAEIGFVTLNGRDLFALLAKTPYAGVVVNPNSTPQLVLSKEALAVMAEG